MNLEQSTDSEEEASETTRLMSETVAMENRAYSSDQGDGVSGGSHLGDASQPVTESVSSLNDFVLFYFVGFIRY